MNLLEAHIEEFEQGTWVADIISDTPFGDTTTVPASGVFQLPDGSTWSGTKIAERQDRGRYFAKVVGGNGKLGETVDDKFYQGQVSLQAAIQTLCSRIGEVAGKIATGVFLTQYQQLVGIGSEALDALAKAAGGAVAAGSAPLLWWIGRDGTLQMQIPDPVSEGRSSAALVSGTQDLNATDVDGSVELVQPEGAELGALYGEDSVRHIRWKMTPNRFAARLFFVPFIFRPPTQRKYDALYNAAIESDNGDGTVNVIAYRSPSDGKSPGFGVNQVPLFCGVPGSKVSMKNGEQVLLGFWGGDPQKPYCVAMAQLTSASKNVARKEDSIKSTSAEDSAFWQWLQTFKTALAVSVNEPGNGAPSAFQLALNGALASLFPDSLTGKITSGSPRLSVDDG